MPVSSAQVYLIEARAEDDRFRSKKHIGEWCWPSFSIRRNKWNWLLGLWQVKLQSCGQSGQVFVLLPIRWSNMIKRRPKEHLWSDQKKGWAFFGSWAMENGHLFCKIAFFAILEFSNTLWVSMIQFLCGASHGSVPRLCLRDRGTGWIFAGVPILLVWLGFRVLSEIRWISSE